MNFRIFIVVTGLFFGLVSCRKNEEKIQGTWSGIFTAEYASNSYSGEVTVVFDNGNYTCSSGTNRIPAGGSGKYNVKGLNIEFEDENIWTADFDWGLILNGKYNFELTSKHLTLRKTGASAKYTYSLSR